MEARFYSSAEGKVRCELCYQGCTIAPGETGHCRVRKNEGGVLNTLIYGLASAVHADPIEKKPLYHFHPGTDALSFGTYGCNFHCSFCQNWDISQKDCDDRDGRGRRVSVDDVVRMAKGSNCDGVAWTYNEPTIWHEFTYDASVAAKEAGLYTCYVTNGYIQPEPLRELAPVLDAMNIDVKAFRDGFYQKFSGAHLKPVLRTAELAVELGIHVELTYLIVPGENDDPDELRDFAKWAVGSLGADVPLHFSRFHGDYKMSSHGGTPMETMELAYRTAKEEGANFVYLGNVRTDKGNTFCPECGEVLIDRSGFSVTSIRVVCEKCGYRLPVAGP